MLDGALPAAESHRRQLKAFNLIAQKGKMLKNESIPNGEGKKRCFKKLIPNLINLMSSALIVLAAYGNIFGIKLG